MVVSRELMCRQLRIEQLAEACRRGDELESVPCPAELDQRDRSQAAEGRRIGRVAAGAERLAGQRAVFTRRMAAEERDAVGGEHIGRTGDGHRCDLELAVAV